jgi:N-acetylmuramoyl-L-alanine amidase
VNRPILLSAYALLAALAAAWLAWPLADPPPWREEIPPEDRPARLAARAGPLTVATVTGGLRLLDPDGVLAAGLEKTDVALRLRDETKVAALEIPWTTEESATAPQGPTPSSDDAPLTGLRIVLDPGHHGGAWSEIESRHFPVFDVPARAFGDDTAMPGARPVLVTAAESVMPPEGARRLGVIREGDLNWATARLLEEKLTAAGAEVHLTRGPPPDAPFPAGLDPRFDAESEARLWLDEARYADPVLRGWARLMPMRIAHLALERWVERRMREDVHALYTRWDLRRRAEVAAEMGADLTLSLHYNYARHPGINYVVVFMPGHKSAEELHTSSARHHALARLVEGDLPVTAEIGRRIGRALHQRLEMPEPPPFAPLPSLRPQRWPVAEDARLFARNLAIVRRTPGPVLLLEGPFMNHPDEALRLLEPSAEIDAIAHPARARAYAEAVRDAVVESAPLLFERRHRREMLRPERSGDDPGAGGI